jgi:anti-sigma regulatory factor (Ser/Thr protein kinase)
MSAAVSPASELRLGCPAQSRYVAPARHTLESFLQALRFDRAFREDVTTAAGEAMANVVEHAYACGLKTAASHLEMRAKVLHDGKLAIDVLDAGSFVERRPVAGRGFGLRIIRAVAEHLRIETSEGTCVRMTFDPLKMMHVIV